MVSQVTEMRSPACAWNWGFGLNQNLRPEATGAKGGSGYIKSCKEIEKHCFCVVSPEVLVSNSVVGQIAWLIFGAWQKGGAFIVAPHRRSETQCADGCPGPELDSLSLRIAHASPWCLAQLKSGSSNDLKGQALRDPREQTSSVTFRKGNPDDVKEALIELHVAIDECPRLSSFFQRARWLYGYNCGHELIHHSVDLKELVSWCKYRNLGREVHGAGATLGYISFGIQYISSSLSDSQVSNKDEGYVSDWRSCLHKALEVRLNTILRIADAGIREPPRSFFPEWR